MCTYCGTTKYRKIYENHSGAIPKEANGRTYEIHHIDGNHSNNDPTNLKAVTLKEHYDIHYAQGDYSACMIMKLERMDYTPEEISILSIKNNLKRVQNGTHHFLTRSDGTNINTDRVANGTHNWLDGKQQTIMNKKRVEDGTHHFLGGKLVKEKIENGTHNFLGKSNPNYNSTIYNFENINTGEKISMTQNEFITKNSVNKTGISLLCSGKRKSHKNWKISQ